MLSPSSRSIEVTDLAAARGTTERGAAPRGARPAGSTLVAALLGALLTALGSEPAAAMPPSGSYLVFDSRTGEIVAKHNPDQKWYPASITKLMTTWVVLQAIRAGRVTPATLVPMTPQGARQPPSKMGFKPGEAVTVDNALKIIMVKSANDVSWALGEAVGGSKEAFVAEMNRQARLIGMTSTHWANPNGLPEPTQVSTARDLGLLARALLREFPEAEELWHLPGIQYGNDVIRNHNHLIDHYPGADGMKTGFICASGFNVVASATRGNKRLVAVVLGARSARQRAEIAAELFTTGFESTGGGLFGRFSAPETLDHLMRGPEAGNPVRDVKQEICGKKRGEAPDPEDLGGEPPRSAANNGEGGAIIRPGSPEAAPRRTSYLSQRFDPGPPVRVWLGGVDAAPSDASAMLALAADPSLARIPLFAGGAAAAAAAMPAAGARPTQPATGPGAGAGLGATLKPADGKPMTLDDKARRLQSAAHTPEPPKAKGKPTPPPQARVEPKKPTPKPDAKRTAQAPKPDARPPAKKPEPAPKKKPKPGDD